MSPSRRTPISMRGIAGMTGSIANAAATGMSVATLTDYLRQAVEASGGRWTTATTRAVGDLYNKYADAARKGLSLSHVRGDIQLGPRWIGYGFLSREPADYYANPRHRVQFQYRGTRDGLAITGWLTAIYTEESPLPKTVGELRDDLINTALESDSPTLEGAILNVGSLTINAI